MARKMWLGSCGRRLALGLLERNEKEGKVEVVFCGALVRGSWFCSCLCHQRYFGLFSEALCGFCWEPVDFVAQVWLRPGRTYHLIILYFMHGWLAGNGDRREYRNKRICKIPTLLSGLRLQILIAQQPCVYSPLILTLM